MTTLKLRFLISALLLSGAVSLSAQQAWYVSPDGDNAATGSSLATAWKTIEYGLATIAPGDTLLVADGLYVETGLLITQQSTADKPTVVKSINQWGAKIEGTTQYSTILQAEGAAHVVIDGFEVFNNENRPFQDWNTGIQIFGSNYVTVQNCYVHDCGCGGVSGRESDYMTIRRNVTRDNAKTNPYNCSGISIYQPIQLDDLPGTHIWITENVTFENECRLPFSPAGFDIPTDGNGIILDDYKWTQGAANQPPFVAETLVENNLSFNNGGAGMKAFEVTNAIFRNNTSVGNNYVLEEYSDNIAEIAGQAVDGEMIFHNNIAVQGFGQRGYAMYWEPNGSEATLDVRHNVIVGDVRWRRTPTTAENVQTNFDRQGFAEFAQIIPDDFTFTSVDDFRQFFAVREGSPALSAGNADLAPATDLTGRRRASSGQTAAGAFTDPEPGVGPIAADRVLEGEITQAAIPVTVDGLLDPIYLGDANAIDRLTDGRGSGSDLSASWYASWDETALYILVDVTDSRLHNDSSDPSEDDSVEIFIDADNSRSSEYDGVNDFHYILGWNDTNFVERSRNATTGVTAAQSNNFTGYRKEIAIPWTTLGVTPSADMVIGLDFRVNDDDNDGEADGRISWQDRNNEAAVDPSTFGTGRLVTSVPPTPIPSIINDPIVVDGQLDGTWDGAEVHQLSNLVDGEVTDETDLSATWRAKWNNTFLYLFIAVNDDELRANSPEFYNDDGVELFFDTGLERSATYDVNDRQLSITYGTNTVIARQGTLGQGVSTTVLDTETGYNVEVRLPWSVLGISPAANKFFGFDIHVNDDDNIGSREAKYTWFATEDDSAERPASFGLVFLTEGDPSAVFDASVAAPLAVFPNPTQGLITLDLPTIPSTVTVTDLQGREVLRAVDTVRLDLGQLPAASYVVSAIAGDKVYRSVVVKD